MLSVFHPRNPTGRYSLVLSQLAHFTIASRLLDDFVEQYLEGMCSFPRVTCWRNVTLNGKVSGYLAGAYC